MTCHWGRVVVRTSGRTSDVIVSAMSSSTPDGGTMATNARTIASGDHEVQRQSSLPSGSAITIQRHSSSPIGSALRRRAPSADEARGFGLDDVTDDEVQVHAVLSHLGFRHLLEHELRAAPAGGRYDRPVRRPAAPVRDVSECRACRTRPSDRGPRSRCSPGARARADSHVLAGEHVEALPQQVQQRDRRELADALPVTRQARRHRFDRDAPAARCRSTPCRPRRRPARSGPATPVTEMPTSAPSTRGAHLQPSLAPPPR